MGGPFRLTRRGINRQVPNKTPGAYVVGSGLRRNYAGARAIGRADTDLAATLHGQIGLYDSFLFQAAGSAEDAFRLECELYHRLDRPDLKHPIRPAGTDWRCPVCGIAGDDDDSPDTDAGRAG